MYEGACGHQRAPLGAVPQKPSFFRWPVVLQQVTVILLPPPSSSALGQAGAPKPGFPHGGWESEPGFSCLPDISQPLETPLGRSPG